MAAASVKLMVVVVVAVATVVLMGMQWCTFTTTSIQYFKMCAYQDSGVFMNNPPGKELRHNPEQPPALDCIRPPMCPYVSGYVPLHRPTCPPTSIWFL